MLPNRLECRDALAVPNTKHDIPLFVLAFGRDDQSNRLPNSFGRRVPVHAFRGRVPRGDQPVEVLTDDRILGMFDDVGEPAGEFVGGLSIGNVARKASGVQEFVVAPQHVRIDLNEANRAIFTAQARLVIQECLASRQTREDVCDDGCIDVELGDVVTDVLLT